MTEPEYILVSDLSSLRAATTALREIVPASNPAVPEQEYREVLLVFDRWRTAMHAQVRKGLRKERRS